jgi:CRISPR-associated protein Csm2
MGRSDRSRDRDQEVSIALSEADRRRIIVEGNPEKLVKEAERIGYKLQQAGLNSAQIRNVFGAVRQIQFAWPYDAGESDPATWQAYRRLQLLKPKLEYTAARNKQVKPLKDVLIPAIDDVGADRQRFQNLVDFFEAILAYHKAAGGK